jgi:hypothetical protein
MGCCIAHAQNLCRPRPLSNATTSPNLQASQLLCLVTLIAGVGFSQERPDESYEMPSFETADTAQPSTPPAPPPAPAKVISPVWPSFFSTLALTASFGPSVVAGGEFRVGYAFGAPRRTDNVSGEETERYTGWQIAPLASFALAKADGAYCRGSRFCSDRTQLGLFAWISRNIGSKLPTTDMTVERQLYGQLGSTIAFREVPSAPLVMGLRWTNVNLSARIGIREGGVAGKRIFSESTSLDASAFLEVPLSGLFDRSVSVGLSLGIGF